MNAMLLLVVTFWSKKLEAPSTILRYKSPTSFFSASPSNSSNVSGGCLFEDDFVFVLYSASFGSIKNNPASILIFHDVNRNSLEFRAFLKKACEGEYIVFLNLKLDQCNIDEGYIYASLIFPFQLNSK